jgi:hypothetical protein
MPLKEDTRSTCTSLFNKLPTRPTLRCLRVPRSSAHSGTAPGCSCRSCRIHTETGCTLPSMSEKRDSEEAESARLESLYRKATDPVLRTHLLMVWRMSLGDSIREVARRVGYSQKWVREIARRYESEGVEGLGDRRHGNPGAIREGIARRGGPSTVAPSSSRGGSTRRRDVERTESGTLDRAEDRYREGA